MSLLEKPIVMARLLSEGETIRDGVEDTDTKELVHYWNIINRGVAHPSFM